MARTSAFQALTDGIAKKLWSGDVRKTQGQQGNLTGGLNTYQREFPVRKEDGVRRGRMPQHIADPNQGKPRPFDPFSLRKLADTEPVQAAMGTIIKDMRSIPTQVVPLDEDAEVDEGLLTDIERAIHDPNPNPEKLTDINEMLLRDAMEVGNLSAVINPFVDGRRAEVIPLDPNTFTVEWSNHRIIEEFWQYPNAAGSRFGRPQQLDVERVMWGVANPETQRAGFYGHSPVEKLQMSINVLGGLVESEIKELEEGMPPGLISLVGDSWSDDDYEAFETYWQNEVKGEQHKAPYARGEAEFVPFKHSYSELQVLERQQWYHKLVGAVFNVPVSESGLQVGETNRATDVSIRQKYKQNGLRPWLQLLEDVWTKQYIHRYWSEEAALQFNPGLDLMERKELANIHSTRLNDGVLTINEVREELGKEQVEWGDEPFDRKTHVRQQGGGLGGMMGGFGPGSDGDGGGGSQEQQEPDGSTPEGDAQGALEEGTEQDIPGPGDEGNPKSQSGGPTWLAGLTVRKDEDEPLRSTDNPHQFNFQPQEIEALQADLEDTFAEYIERVKNQVRGQQELLRSDTTSKSMSTFLKLIQEEIGMEFAEDVAAVLTEHKTEKILDGEENILDELASAGVALDDIALEPMRDRVVQRIQKRTLRVTKPVSQRLEDELRDTLEEGWRKGQGIEEIERNIEELTDKWQGTDAERLARDQLGKASKEGRMEYAAETGDKVGGWMKTWLTTGGSTGDSRTRKSHEKMHETTVPRSQPFDVNYIYDGGPASVAEDYPGASRYGIQCRCDYALAPQQKVAKAQEWADEPPERMQPRIEEVEAEQEAPIWEVLVAKEYNPDTSRSQAASDLGVSKRTYYKWGRQAGLIES